MGWFLKKYPNLTKKDRQRFWFKKNYPRLKLLNKKWKKEHPEKVAEGKRKWYAKNRDRELARLKKQRLENPARYKEYQRIADLKLRTEVLTYYSKNGYPECCCCGETEFKFLTIDHINNNGAKERRETGKPGGRVFYSYLRRRKYPLGYQTLCYNCNCSKGFYGHCPHQKGGENI